MNIFKYSTNIW